MKEILMNGSVCGSLRLCGQTSRVEVSAQIQFFFSSKCFDTPADSNPSSPLFYFLHHPLAFFSLVLAESTRQHRETTQARVEATNGN